MLKEELEIIFFYLKNKRYAVSKMKSFVAPLNTDSLDNMQVIYSLYFYSLFSLVDYIKNVLKQGQILTDFYAIVGGENNYKYVRELRNSMIHRGLDVSLAGCNLANTNIIVPFSPKTVVDYRNPNIKYKTFTDNLLQLVYETEKLNQKFFNICSNLKLLEYKYLTKEEMIQRELEDPYIPEEFKKMSYTAELDYEIINKNLKEIHEKRILKYFNTSDLL